LPDLMNINLFFVLLLGFLRIPSFLFPKGFFALFSLSPWLTLQPLPSSACLNVPFFGSQLYNICLPLRFLRTPFDSVRECFYRPLRSPLRFFHLTPYVSFFNRIGGPFAEFFLAPFFFLIRVAFLSTPDYPLSKW